MNYNCTGKITEILYAPNGIDTVETSADISFSVCGNGRGIEGHGDGHVRDRGQLPGLEWSGESDVRFVISGEALSDDKIRLKFSDFSPKSYFIQYSKPDFQDREHMISFHNFRGSDPRTYELKLMSGVAFDEEWHGPGDSRVNTIIRLEVKMEVEIYVDSFIPMARLTNPVPVRFPTNFEVYYHAFAGDNRGFVRGGSARIWAVVKVDMLKTDALVSKKHDTGITTGYRYQITSRRGAEIRSEVSDTAKAPTTDLHEDVSRAGRNTIVVKIYGQGKDPLLAVAPYINYNYEITLTRTEKGVDYNITGTHDGFPSYSIYVDSKLVHSHDCISTGDTPSALWGSSDVSVRAAGTTSNCK